MRTFLALVLTACLASAVHGQVPRQFSYQGLLLQNSAPVQGSCTIQAAIYDSIQGGHLLFSDQYSVTPANGVFEVNIGSGLPLPDSLTFSRPYFLGISVNGGSELPRTSILSTPYALRSSSADTALAISNKVKGVVTNINTLSGGLVLQGAGTTTITQKSDTLLITSSAAGGTGIQGIQNLDGSLAISNPNGPTATIRVGDSAISTKLLASGAVTTTRLGDGSVTGGKIAQATVTTQNISTQGATKGSVLTASGSSTPNWQLVDLTSSVTGILPVTNGGTGQSAPLIAGGILYGASTTAATSSPAGTRGQVLTASNFAQPYWQTPDYVQTGSLIAFPDPSARSGYSYTGAVAIHEGWRTLSTAGAMPSSEHCAAAFGGKVYVFGGWAPYFAASSRVQQYDPSTDQWTTKSNTGFTPGFGGGATLMGSKIYVVCAADGLGHISTRTEVYDPSTDSWVSKAPIPTGVEGSVVLSVGKFVYCISGEIVGTAGTNLVQVYDTSSNTWSLTNSGSFTARRHPCGAQVNGKIYIFGGQIGGGATSNEVWEYDAVGSQTWKLKSSSGFTPRYSASCAVVDNKIYVFGGWNDISDPVNAVEVYDPLRDRWDAVQIEGWTSRKYSTAASVAGKIYVFGGGDVGAPSYQVVSTHEVLDPNAVKQYWFKKN